MLKNRLQGALIGFGSICERGHLAAYLERSRVRGDVEIRAIADVCEQRRRLAETLVPGARIYDSHRELLAAEAPHLDFVDIATPPSEHARIAHDAIDRRLHVLCEKPLAVSEAEARAMLQHAWRSGRVLFPVHNYKHAPVVKAVRSAIATGALGSVRLVTLNTYRTTHARGVSEWRPNWRRERRFSGGGIGMDHGAHTFYLAFEWLGGYPESISATHALGTEDTESDFACTLRTHTGVAYAQLTWNAGFRKVIYTIHGDKGGIRVDDDQLELITSEGNGSKVNREVIDVPSLWQDSSHHTWFDSVFEDFRAHIEAHEWVSRDTWDAYMSVRTIDAGYESARSGSQELLIPQGPDDLRPSLCA